MRTTRRIPTLDPTLPSYTLASPIEIRSHEHQVPDRKSGCHRQFRERLFALWRDGTIRGNDLYEDRNRVRGCQVHQDDVGQCSIRLYLKADASGQLVVSGNDLRAALAPPQHSRARPLPPLQEQRGAAEEAREGAGWLAPQHISDVFCFSWAVGSSALPQPVPTRAQARSRERSCC